MGNETQRPDLETRFDIETLVRSFYRAAAVDDLLGPIFDAAELDWPSHIERIADFWTWQLLGGERYERNPLLAHRPVHERTPFADEHYERWLALFAETIDEGFSGPVADAAKGRAAKMANAMQRLLDGRAGAGTDPTEVMIVTPSPVGDDI